MADFILRIFPQVPGQAVSEISLVSNLNKPPCINLQYKCHCYLKSDDQTDHTPSSATSSRRESTISTTSSPVALENLAEGLPPGWSVQRAPNGRLFFIDHNERTTSWVDPRTGRASPMPGGQGGQSGADQGLAGKKPEDDLGPLPEGWEERVHTDGRIFFIDHSKSNRLTPVSIVIHRTIELTLLRAFFQSHQKTSGNCPTHALK